MPADRTLMTSYSPARYSWREAAAAASCSSSAAAARASSSRDWRSPQGVVAGFVVVAGLLLVADGVGPVLAGGFAGVNVVEVGHGGGWKG